MLPELQIPERYYSGFRQIIALDESEFLKLLSTLQNEPPAIDYVKLSSLVSSKLTNLPSDSVYDIIEVVDSLYAARTSFGASVEDFTEAVGIAAREIDSEQLNLSEDSSKLLKARLKLLLDIDSLEATGKATGILLEHEHTLHGVRVLTDIRPVFTSAVEDSPAGAVIVHMLKLAYHDESQEVKEFYMALDAGDTDVLIDALKQANSKAESLKQVLGKAEVPYIDVD